MFSKEKQRLDKYYGIKCYVCEKTVGRHDKYVRISAEKSQQMLELKAFMLKRNTNVVEVCKEDDIVCKSCYTKCQRGKYITSQSSSDPSTVTTTIEIVENECFICKEMRSNIEMEGNTLNSINSNEIIRIRKAHIHFHKEDIQCSTEDYICCVCQKKIQSNLSAIDSISVEGLFESLPQMSEMSAKKAETFESSKRTDSEELEPKRPSKPKVMKHQFPIKSSKISSSSCLFTPTKKTGLIRLSRRAIIDAYIQTQILIPETTRVCQENLTTDNFLNDESLNKLYAVHDKTELSDEEFKRLNNEVLHIASVGKFSDFEKFENIRERKLIGLTGLNKSEFKILFDLAKPKMKDSVNRSISQALLIYLYKMKTGNSNEVISIHFILNSHQRVADICDQVRKILYTEFVPKYLGVNHKSSEELRNEYTSQLAKKHLDAGDDELIIIMDGTYIYIQKSSNYWFQRKSYSGQKLDNLLKPMIITTTTGYIIDCFTSFAATENDSTITKKLLDDNDFKSFLFEKPHKVRMVLDRGFRDVRDVLTSKGIKHDMPALASGKSQLSTIEANLSRKVTKIRWPIEVVNGHLKTKFRYFDHTLQNRTLSHMKEDIKIMCALLNLQYKPLVSDYDNPTIADLINSKVNVPNELQDFVTNNNLLRLRKNWINMDPNSIIGFPELTLEELYQLTLGPYQLKQSLSYISEHLDEDSPYVIKVFAEQIQGNHILRALLQSRHKSTSHYKTFIEYSESSYGLNAIKGYYCTCKTGARTVGCCSHIASVIYYLSYGRYNEDPRPAQSLSNILTNLTPIVYPSDEEDE